MNGIPLSWNLAPGAASITPVDGGAGEVLPLAETGLLGKKDRAITLLTTLLADSSVLGRPVVADSVAARVTRSHGVRCVTIRARVPK